MRINWRRNVKTRKEDRQVLLFITSILIIIYAYTYFYKPTRMERAKPLSLEELLIPVEQQDKRKEITTAAKKKFKKLKTKRTKPKRKYPPVVNFKFDPNKLDSLQWIKLGVRPWTIKTIRSYQAKGGQFRKCEDLAKIYNLPDSVYQRISNYCTLVAPPPKVFASKYPSKKYTSKYPPRKKRSDKIININVATREELKSLWGIGPVVSEAVIERRERLGGFHSKEQFAEVWGITDSVLLMNKKRIHITAPFRYININGSEDSLSRHYLISYNLAKLIVRYRRQHGEYQKIEDIKKLRTISDSTYLELAPYLRVK